MATRPLLSVAFTRARPSASSVTSTSASSTSAKPAPNQAEVRVYNISSKEGVAKTTADELSGAGFKVTKVDNLTGISDITATTVYYTDADGEHATADAIGQKLQVPVEARIPALASQPPGVIVLVAG